LSLDVQAGGVQLIQKRCTICAGANAYHKVTAQIGLSGQ